LIEEEFNLMPYIFLYSFMQNISHHETLNMPYTSRSNALCDVTVQKIGNESLCMQSSCVSL